MKERVWCLSSASLSTPSLASGFMGVKPRSGAHLAGFHLFHGLGLSLRQALCVICHRSGHGWVGTESSLMLTLVGGVLLVSKVKTASVGLGASQWVGGQGLL